MMRLLWGVIAPAAVIIPLVIAMWKRRQLSQPLRLFVYYLLFGGCLNAVAIVLARNRINNMPLGHLFTFVEGLLLLYFYSRLTKSPLAKRILTWSAVLFTVFFSANIFFFQDIFTYNSYSRSLEAFLMMMVSIWFLYHQLSVKEIVLQAWSHNPFLWITIGLLIYFSGSLFLFVFSEVMSRKMLFYKMGWAIHAALVLLLYVLSAVALLRSEKQNQIIAAI